MATLASRAVEREEVGATGVHFVGDTLCVSLSEGREISVAMDRVEWLDWLAKATPAQRTKWSLEPGGFAVYWDELDNGIEIRHLIRGIR